MPIYIFYKIVCKDENIKDCYVGKTTDLKRRWREHKKNCNNENRSEYNLKLYQFIRENDGWNNWNIIEIDKGEYDDKDSSIRERYWFEELNANLNCKTPSRTRKEFSEEYYEKNKEKINETCKEYRDNNKEILNEKVICECGCEITKKNLIRHKKTKKHIIYL